MERLQSIWDYINSFPDYQGVPFIPWAIFVSVVWLILFKRSPKSLFQELRSRIINIKKILDKDFRDPD